MIFTSNSLEIAKLAKGKRENAAFDVAWEYRRENESLAARDSIKKPFLPANKIIIIELKTQKIKTVETCRSSSKYDFFCLRFDLRFAVVSFGLSDNIFFIKAQLLLSPPSIQRFSGQISSNSKMKLFLSLVLFVCVLSVLNLADVPIKSLIRTFDDLTFFPFGNLR